MDLSRSRSKDRTRMATTVWTIAQAERLPTALSAFDHGQVSMARARTMFHRAPVVAENVCAVLAADDYRPTYEGWSTAPYAYVWASMGELDPEVVIDKFRRSEAMHSDLMTRVSWRELSGDDPRRFVQCWEQSLSMSAKVDRFPQSIFEEAVRGVVGEYLRDPPID